MKKKVFFLLAGMCLFVYGAIYFQINLPPLRAANSNSLDTGNVTKESRVVFFPGTSAIDLHTSEGDLYQTQATGAGGAMEFFNKDPQVGSDPLLPSNFKQTVRMYKQHQTGNESHYFYQQSVNGVPVYASQLAVHQREGNKIYSVQGNLVTDSQVWSGSLTVEDAKIIALTEAKKTVQVDVQVTGADTLIFNGLSIGANDDPNNYLCRVIYIASVLPSDGFGRKYFVSTVDGNVLFSEDLIREALNRKVNNCNNSTNCSKSRYEGDPATGIHDIDLTYDTLGNYYNFLKNSFNRDSFDGHGSAFTSHIDFWANQACPNAWSEGENVYICKGLVAPDVISHEFTHSMSHSGPDFVYANQSGAIDEALADIYAAGVDGNWTMGETTDSGIERSIEDPPKYGQPDRLFSQNYWCKAGEDQGGVHTNGGVLSKAFYLMTVGGTFNGCTITGVGKEKAYAILYKAEMSYMTASTNYKTVYNAVIQACGDLYGGQNSNDCIQVRNSLRAVEMDQQPAGSQKSPVCTDAQAAKPDCTAAPAPTTANPSATTAPTGTQPTPVKTTPTPTSIPQSVSMQLKLRLQGVFARPSNGTTVPVKIKLGGTRLQTPIVKTVSFAWLDGGTLQASFTLDGVAPGDGYALYIKGPLHLERKICDTGPVEIFEGRYACEGRSLTLQKTNTIDAAGILQLAGDIPDDSGHQDDVINSYDLSTIRNNYGTQNAALIKKLDLNYDGKVDSRDFDLANLSSSVRLAP